MSVRALVRNQGVYEVRGNYINQRHRQPGLGQLITQSLALRG